ncbi:MAG: D-alanine--D-alanine ligase [Actinomycetota bacterium]|nr:MAG: D-alanine--D-alanine ligase [Actinomycetota bacterium]
MNGLAGRFSRLEIRKQKNKKIGVLAGGISSEREISLKTGKNIFESLKKSRYNTVFIDMKEDFLDKVSSVDIAFLALHGRYGEDGTVQGLLELLKIPYTGSGVLSSAVVLDKILSKKIFLSENIPTPPFTELDLGRSMFDIDILKRNIIKSTGYPLVIKPNSEGSTIGIMTIYDESQLEDGIRKAVEYDKKILIEKYIKGRELTVGIIGLEPVGLPVIEIKPKSGFFDFESKYTRNFTEYIVPAEIDVKTAESIMEISLNCHNMLGCSGISRVDFILDSSNIPYVLEINTMPGMTSTSLVPMAADAAGISFDFLVEIILDSAKLNI